MATPLTPNVARRIKNQVVGDFNPVEDQEWMLEWASDIQDILRCLTLSHLLSARCKPSGTDLLIVGMLTLGCLWCAGLGLNAILADCLLLQQVKVTLLKLCRQ